MSGPLCVEDTSSESDFENGGRNTPPHQYNQLDESSDDDNNKVFNFIEHIVHNMIIYIFLPFFHLMSLINLSF